MNSSGSSGRPNGRSSSRKISSHHRRRSRQHSQVHVGSAPNDLNETSPIFINLHEVSAATVVHPSAHRSIHRLRDVVRRGSTLAPAVVLSLSAVALPHAAAQEWSSDMPVADVSARTNVHDGSAAIRRIRWREVASMSGLPGRCERRRQQRSTPSRCQRSTVAGWISSSASRHRDQKQRKNSQDSRSAGRSADSPERGHRVGGAGQDACDHRGQEVASRPAAP